MSSSRKIFPFLLFALLGLAGVGGLYCLLQAGGSVERRGRVAVGPSATGAPTREAGDLEQVALKLRDHPVPSETTDSTVLWPLKIELDLVQPAYLPVEKGMVPIGTGRTARFSGRLTGARGEAVRADVIFLKGTNAGRVLRCDSGGSFGANDLYPGLGVVEISGEGILGARREVRLRRGQGVILNIGFGRLASVNGRVQDRKGDGIEGVRVTFDGKVYHTGTEGELYVPSVAGGQVLAEIEKEGYASYQELVWVQAGVTNANRERLVFTLDKEVSLEVALRGNVGGPGPAQLIVLPGQHGYRSTADSAYRNSRFPFHTKNPIEVWPGRPVRIDGLPPNQVVKLYTFRQGAEAKLKVVNLSAREQRVQIDLEPAPKIVGQVTLDGEPVSGAHVRLEAADRPRATLSFFREASYYLETAIIPDIPPAVQETQTGANGRFFLSAWPDESAVRYIEARGKDGKTWAGRFIRAGTEVCDLQLSEVDTGDAALKLAFPGRYQGLPVDLVLNGAPRDLAVLKPSESLEIHDIPSGVWRLRITWHGEPVYKNEELEISGSDSRVVKLPEECIEGQDEESWRRAGREFPGT
ncbi:MAG: hypothetical protein CMJ89_10840 [Planctomycetes bacterium]|nr:hypothetical protein [Planctomycetota bacterium]